MKINQNNYEHYFLMYIDNELSAEDRAAVSDFIILHPNYANKLHVLQQLKINPDNITYENKYSLYKLSEPDEKCISYLENEMTNTEKACFEKRLSDDVYLQTIIKQWRLTFLSSPTNLKIDPNFKNRLYKKSAHIKPLWTNVTFKQWASVAAILFIVIGFKLFNTENKQKAPILINNKGAKIELSESSGIEINRSAYIKATKKAIAINTIKKRVLFPIVSIKKQDQTEYINSNLNSFSNKNVTAPNNVTEMELEPKAAIKTNIIIETASLFNEVSPIIISNVNEEAKNNNETNMHNQLQYANIDNDEEERVINIANLEIDGAKFRELSRKISTLFKRNKPENK